MVVIKELVLPLGISQEQPRYCSYLCMHRGAKENGDEVSYCITWWEYYMKTFSVNGIDYVREIGNLICV